jgi:molybdate transport system substrate-binding protein
MRLAWDIRLLVVVLAGVSACAKAPAIPIVAAASDVSFALNDVAAQFTHAHGEQVELVFAASGLLTRQIRDGAPFELFLSADEAFITDLAASGHALDHGVLYAQGRLVLFAPAGSPIVPAQGLDGLARVMAGDRAARFAIANPEHAPYGRAAEAALRAHGLWDVMAPHLVRGENASQAAQFASSGNTIGGLIPHSLALAPSLKDRGTFALIPETDHPPLRQRMALLKRAGPVARRFYDYVQGPVARAILERHGFSLPPQRQD